MNEKLSYFLFPVSFICRQQTPKSVRQKKKKQQKYIKYKIQNLRLFG